ncbi:MAG: ATP-binding protein [Pseudomonadota bacterium]|nr:ATP-binding protein [Pseudomonadota bacterium]
MLRCPEPAAALRDQVLADLANAFAEAVTDEKRLVQLVVERVGALTGDACVIRLLGDDGALRAVAQYHADAALLLRIRAVSLATDPDPGAGIWQQLLGERRFVRLQISPTALPMGLTADQRTLWSSLPVTYFLGVPLIARGRVLGGILVVRCQRQEPHTDEEVALLRDLGERAALAIDNARLYTAERAARTRAEAAEAALRTELAERMRAEEQRRSSEERLRLLVQAVVDYAIFMIDDAGAISSWNAGAQRIYGWSEAEAIGRHAALLLPTSRPEGAVGDLLEAARNTGRAEVEGWGARRDGSQFWSNTVVSAIRTNGDLLGYAVVTRDLTASRHAEATQSMNAQLEARTRDLAAANEELEAFAYSVSHDLRAPLRAIDGFSQALLEDQGALLDATGQGHLRRVRAGVARMRQLIDDMLQLSRSTRVTLEPDDVDLARIANEVIAELQVRDPGRAVTVHIPERMRVRGDPRLLRIVMENLLGNAWKFTRNTEAAEITVSCELVGDEVSVTVRDNGAGFDMAYARRLFQPFQRLHTVEEFEGTGIGLAIVRRIVHRHGGRVSAEGAPDAGAAFHFTLPAHPDAPPRDAEPVQAG